MLLKSYIIIAALFFSQQALALSLKVQTKGVVAGAAFSSGEEDNENEVYLLSVTEDRVNCTVVFKGQRTGKNVHTHVNLMKGKRKVFDIGFFNSRLDIEVKNCEFIRPATKQASYQKTNLKAVNSKIKRILNYLKLSQVRRTKGTSRFSGEWGSQMIVRKTIPLIGKKGYQAWDSNCFTTSAIYNVLAPIYLKHKEFKQIPSMLNKAMVDIERCKEGDTYAFWHKVEIPQKYKKDIKKHGLGPIRNPNNFVYRTFSAHAFSNIVNDSDDTSSSFISKLYQEKLAQVTTKVPYPKTRLNEITRYFDDYRDINRNVRHPWDMYKSRLQNTGAYLTWFGEESKSNGVFFKYDKKHIPLEINDVDCVVNANILKLFALSDRLNEAKGTDKTCQYLNKVALRKMSNNQCTSYYPNLYNVHFAFSEAYKAGVQCLEPSKRKLLNDVLSTQHTDGSWSSSTEQDDIIQSTVYALNSIFNFDPKLSNKNAKESVERALDFLNRHTKVNTSRKLSLKGGEFFSGGSFVKNSIVWKSDAITTSYYLQALTKVRVLLRKGEWK